MPNCEQCSDLEYLLILERRLKFYGLRNIIHYTPVPSNIKDVSYLAKENDDATKRRLREVETKYKEKFNVPAPWWWICSTEERIRRLEVAIKANKRHPHFPGTEDKRYYNVGKTMAAYEMWLGRPLPECIRTNCSKQERLRHAEQALAAGLPHLSQKEHVALEKELRTEYRKNFETTLSDHWLSVMQLQLIGERFGSYHYHITLTRTASGGVVAKYVRTFIGPYQSVYSLELSIGDWLDFISSLDKLRVNEWTEGQRNHGMGGSYWAFTIYTLKHDKNNWRRYCVGSIDTRTSSGFGGLDRNLKSIFDNIVERVKKEGTESSYY
jgi:hypothetical protein